MQSARMVLVGTALVAAVGSARAAAADVIHLTNGSTIEVDAWRDAGDAIEFARGGGIIRILKTDIQRIDGTSTTADLRMYSAPASLSGSEARAAESREAAVRDMTDLLQQGEDLFGQTVLTARSKADALRRLGAKWRALEVPEPLREAATRGQEALQIAAEAYTAEDEGTAPNTKERIEAAKKAVQEAREVLKKAAGGQG